MSSARNEPCVGALPTIESGYGVVPYRCEESQHRYEDNEDSVVRVAATVVIVLTDLTLERDYRISLGS